MLLLHKPHAVNPNRGVLKFHRPYLHNLVGLTAEVLGTETGEEVCRHRRQKRSEPRLEPLADESAIRKLRLAEVVDFHLTDGIQNVRVSQSEVLERGSGSQCTIPSRQFRFIAVPLPASYHGGERIQGFIQSCCKLLEEELPDRPAVVHAARHSACHGFDQIAGGRSCRL